MSLCMVHPRMIVHSHDGNDRWCSTNESSFTTVVASISRTYIHYPRINEIDSSLSVGIPKDGPFSSLTLKHQGTVTWRSLNNVPLVHTTTEKQFLETPYVIPCSFLPAGSRKHRCFVLIVGWKGIQQPRQISHVSSRVSASHLSSIDLAQNLIVIGALQGHAVLQTSVSLTITRTRTDIIVRNVFRRHSEHAVRQGNKRIKESQRTIRY